MSNMSDETSVQPAVVDHRDVADGPAAPVASPPAPGARGDSLEISTASLRRVLESSFGIWFGFVLAGTGFVVILRAWAKVAGLLDVALQMPYVVSGGFLGMGLIVIGAVFLDVSVRRRDGAERREQVVELQNLIAELRWSIEAPSTSQQHLAGRQDQR